ncbi:MAG: glycoside hydrolase family 2 TIM barrel-domain containing protein [Planctomycetota bacterium]|jgi:hypothetical protein
MKEAVVTLVCSAALLLARAANAETRTLYVYDDMPNFPWSGFMGSNDGRGICLDLRCTECTGEPGDVYAARISFNDCDRCEGCVPETWSGIAIQSSEANWFGPGIDLSGGMLLTFDYRGTEGEQIEIKAFNDQISGRFYTLQTAWQTATIPLSGLDLSDIHNILAIFSADADPKSVELNDIAVIFERPPQTPSEVTLEGQGSPIWSYRILVDGEPFFVRGIGYDSIVPDDYGRDFSLMAEAKVNTIRLWSQGDCTFATLDSADEHGLMVVQGYWLPRGDGGAGPVDYTDPSFRAAIRSSVRNWVSCYRDHPAVLLWVLGNEVFANLSPGDPDNVGGFASLLDELAGLVHAVDPHHLVSYAAVNLEPIEHLCATGIDIYGANSYAAVDDVLQGYGAAGCAKPLAFWEYGGDGWWETDWDTYCERQRARDYGRRAMSIFRSRGLTVGGCAFAWVDKTENDETGWGLVDDDRRAREQLRAVNGVYLSQHLVPEDAAVRIHLNQASYCLGDCLTVSSFVANPGSESRDVDLHVAFAGGGPGRCLPDEVVQRRSLEPYAFRITNSLSVPWACSGSGSVEVRGFLTEPGTGEIIGLDDGIHTLEFPFEDCPGGCCPWDLDGNGTIGIADLLALLAAWGADPCGSADFNGDGVVGVADLLRLLANWGACP